MTVRMRCERVRVEWYWPTYEWNVCFYPLRRIDNKNKSAVVVVAAAVACDGGCRHLCVNYSVAQIAMIFAMR